MSWIDKYADLLVHYSLYLKAGERVFVRTTTLAEPLLKAFFEKATEAGAIVETEISFENQDQILLSKGKDHQLSHVSASFKQAMTEFDAVMVIRAPYLSAQKFQIPAENRKTRMHSIQTYDQLYFERLGNGSLKRSLCQYPTAYGAFHAGMTLDEYTLFIQQACFLNEENPAVKWKELSAYQQGIVDYLNTCDHIIYRNPQFEISFSVKGRTWINSDGKANMPSGEVFTSPVEDSVDGEIYFNFPSIYQEQDVQGIRLIVKAGEVVEWKAEVGQELLDRIFQIEGSRRFGEVAIATNKNIQRPTKNILFDEKIGGTVHMAIGQSYLQSGGKNHSSIHWDMITDMRKGGEIVADGVVIYRDGEFLI
ncbi:MAG: aminopeptidase [Saprospiraceae bacterium]|nr:aminopeptidase [Saprospiraceae bacterium]